MGRVISNFFGRRTGLVEVFFFGVCWIEGRLGDWNGVIFVVFDRFINFCSIFVLRVVRVGCWVKVVGEGLKSF